MANLQIHTIAPYFAEGVLLTHILANKTELKKKNRLVSGPLSSSEAALPRDYSQLTCAKMGTRTLLEWHIATASY